MKNSNSTGKILVAMIAGAAIGGVLGILLAPDKGSETRKKISGKAEDLSDAVKDKFVGLMDAVKKNVASVKERATEFMDHNGTEKV